MVKLNFEIKEELEKEIKELKNQITEITPKAQKEYEDTREFGKFAKLKNKLIDKRDKKQEELNKVLTTISQNNEPVMDPVKKVIEKYDNRLYHNQSINLLLDIIPIIDKLTEKLREVDRIYPIYRMDRAYYIQLDSMRYNIGYILQYERRPKTMAGYEEEMKEAKEKVRQMREKERERLELEAEYGAEE